MTAPDVAGMSAFDAGGVLDDAGFQVRYTMGGMSAEPAWSLTAAATTPAAGMEAVEGGVVEVDLIAEDPIPHEVEIDGQRAVVWIDQPLTIQQAWILTNELDPPEGGYFVEINCKTGGTSSAYNRQANGKLAVGERGGKALGLRAGVRTVELVDGAACTPATANPDATEPPAQCLGHDDTEADKAVRKAVGKAKLPPTVELMHVQTIDSPDEPGALEAVVRICSEQLTDEEHREIATTIAKAVYAADLDTPMTRFYVTSWIPDGDSVQQSTPLHIEDFDVYLWDTDTANPDKWWLGPED